MKSGNANGKVGFDKSAKTPDPEIISKEETMFKLDSNGKIIPEQYPVEIYDRNMEQDLLEEGLFLLEISNERKKEISIIGLHILGTNRMR